MAQPGSITLRVYIKATTNEAVSVPVPVSYIEQRNTARLRDKLAKSRELEGVLRTHYRDGDWEILDHLDRPYDPDATTLENNSTLVLGKQREEKKCQITLKVTHQAHHKVMTDSAARFHSEGGKRPPRLLFCEFIDNSIEAYRRAKPGAQRPARIEVHLVYKKVQWDATLNLHQKLQQIVIVDYGPGLNYTQLIQWAEMANPTADRKRADVLRPLKREPPCHADGLLGKFGAGSKAAGFLYGTNVRVVTSHEEGFRKAVGGGNLVYEMLLDEEEFAEKKKDWAQGEGARRANPRSAGARPPRATPGSKPAPACDVSRCACDVCVCARARA